VNEADYILTEEQAKEACDELMVRIAISSYTKLHGQQVAEDNERLRQDPAYQITPEARKRFERTVNRAFRKKSVALALKGVYRVANKAASQLCHGGGGRIPHARPPRRTGLENKKARAFHRL
jgi:hypothetical protein